MNEDIVEMMEEVVELGNKYGIANISLNLAIINSC
jgi:hypothetical protein